MKNTAMVAGNGGVVQKDPVIRFAANRNFALLDGEFAPLKIAGHAAKFGHGRLSLVLWIGCSILESHIMPRNRQDGNPKAQGKMQVELQERISGGVLGPPSTATGGAKNRVQDKKTGKK
ncbi:MAG: hypothetical protein PHI93_00525 [Kiritimatiellae bacterium]|jgi:hypothetical protein|nr:hypothetical protein [Kiritimatiellia bacterium]MDY0150158.1 hypothetical protein [Kiritimatiellia bacterium]